MELENLKEEVKRYHLKGNFVLSSGGHAADYFDLAPVLLSSRGLSAVAMAVDSLLVVGYSIPQYDAIGCLELCPVPLVGVVLALTRYQDSRGFVVRKARKGYGTNKLIEGDLRAGDRALLLEDVTSSGQSVMRAVRAVEEVGAKVVTIVAVVNRGEGCNELLRDYDFRWIFTKEELG